NSTVKGLTINGFTSGAGINIDYVADSTPSNNQILNNYIGTDAAGAVAVANGGAISIHGFGSPSAQATNNTISGNLISGNGSGIGLCDANGTAISGNYIGTNAAGANLGNGVVGITMGCAGVRNTTISGNTIAFNAGDGIHDEPDYNFGQQHFNNKFTQNSIYANSGLGINLIPPSGTDTVTPNDNQDADDGANHLQNFPVITSAKVQATNYTVNGTLNTNPNSSAGYVIEFFKNTSCDSSGNGEGQTYLGSVTTGNTDANGDVSFTFNSSTPFARDDIITATATDSNGNTSEFSACFTATAVYTITASAGAHGSIVPSGAVLVDQGGSQSFTISANSCYHIADVLVDGVSQGAISSYTFSNVQADHTIAASFAVDTYMISASTGSHGSINPLGAVSVNCGSDQSFSISADSGYQIQDVLVDGVSQGAIPSYTFTNVQANHTISASFVVTCGTITLSPSSLPDGQVGVAYSQTIGASGGTASYSFGVTGGSLPDGLSLATDGTLSGTPSAYGTFNFTVTATDANNCTGNQGYSLVIAPPETLIVTKTADTNGTCLPGDCSLREAINAANSNPDSNTITFDIPVTDSGHVYYQDDGVPNHVTNDVNHVVVTTAADDSSLPADKDPDWAHSWWTINPTSALPAITSPVEINGYSQAGASANTQTDNTDDAVLRIELNGSGLPANIHGLVLNSPSAIEGLAINRFSGNGIGLLNGSSNGFFSFSLVSGNFVGTDISGTLAEANGLAGVYITQSSGQQVGCQLADERNIISGNTGEGISILSSGGNFVQGNLIGLATNGTSLLGNGGHGIEVYNSASNNTIGAPPGQQLTTAARSDLSSSPQSSSGRLRCQSGGTATQSLVKSNSFATNDFSNSLSGANVIAGNGEDGIRISSPDDTGNLVSQNSIFSNTGLGINLGTDGVTANNFNNHVGPNNYQNFPVITRAVADTQTITGTLDATGGTADFTIEFFNNGPNGCDSSGNGEGKTFIGSITTSGGSFTATLNANSFAVGDVITATATDANFNTSEFSACATAVAATPGTLQLSSATYQVNENGGSIDVHVTRTGGSDGAVSIDYGTAPNSATAGSDYTTASGTLNWADGDATDKIVTITILDDTVYENDENFSISISNPRGGAALGSPSTASIAIIENDPKPSFSITPAVSHLEGNSGTTAFDFTVTKTGDTAVTATVQVATADGTASAPSDYAAINPAQTLTFAANETSKTVTVLVNGDTTVEPDETFTVNLSNPTEAVIASGQGTGTGTIQNDDSACPPPSTVYVDDDWASATPGTDPDGAGPATNFGCDSFATIQGGIDGVASGGTVIVYAGTYTQSIGSINLNKSLTLEGPNAAISPNGGARVPEALINGSVATVLRISAPATTVTIAGFEFDSTGVIDNYDTGQNITINKNVFSNGSGGGAFYFLNGPAQLTIDDNYLPNPVQPDNDAIFVAGNWNGTTGTAATITNNVLVNTPSDSCSGINLSNVSGTISGNTLTKLRYYAILLANNSSSITISGNVFDGMVNPDPTNVPTWGAGVRTFTPAFTGPVNITSNTFVNNYVGVGIRGVPPDPGANIGTNVHVNFNRIVNNTYGISMGAAGTLDAENNWWGCNYGPGAGGAGCTGTPNGIFNNSSGGSGIVDADPWIVLGTSASPATVASGGNSSVTADMTHNSDNAAPSGTTFIPPVGVAFSATNGTMAPPAGTTTSGQDSSTFTSTNGSDGTACSTVDGQQVCTNITVTIPSFSIDNVTQAEGNSGTTAFTFTVTKTGASGLTSTVQFATADNTAKVSDSDYQANSGTLTFGPSDTSMRITVLVNGDTKLEPDETFFVNLSNPTNATISQAQGIGTIQNDDSGPTFSIDNVTQAEGNGPGTTNFTFTVTKTGTTAERSRVDFATADGTSNPATGGGACGGSVDYVSQTGTLQFQPADTTKTITIGVCGDANF
ncbi:MAG TPA: Calx-beta domain-containing protein, partial [Pyrinomonadaceae bacterium]|nr:Calx-beta domain-containing protein [Pyrinomonadaceae bacterium]